MVATDELKNNLRKWLWPVLRYCPWRDWVILQKSSVMIVGL